ncbi:AMP-binding protein [Hyphococcus formosus]|uniref:AMP-binding protein n=1 Tax=Hyphococcus formosus TaxID=3143534 RepID=UPI00398AE6C6
MTENQYQNDYQAWLRDPEAYWLNAARNIPWFTPPSLAHDSHDDQRAVWFPDGKTNACYAALDIHVDNGAGNQTALIYESPVSGASDIYTYQRLLDKTAHLAGGLKELGVKAGDRVVIYMPMIPQAIIAMLACARIGAIHSVVFGGFAARELAARIDHAKPKVIISASCGIEPTRLIPYKPLLDEALAIASHQPQHCVIYQREQMSATLIADRDIPFEILANAPPAPCEAMDAASPLYILYTSGTTGAPKGVVRDTGGYIVALKWSMENVYDSKPGDVFWAASDIGWVVGHSYIVYGPLINGCATVLYEGKPNCTPDAGAYWRLIQKHKVSTLFTAPTAIRAIRRDDPDGSYIGESDISSLKHLFLAGERADPDTVKWASGKLGIPVIDHWWQTELGWPAIAACAGLGETDTRTGSAGRAVSGYKFEVKSEDGKTVPPLTEGALVIKLPLPPGCLSTLWEAEEQYQDAYLTEHEGYYLTGDAGYVDDEGFIFVMGRTDDVINVAGHRLSTGAMEEVLSQHPDVVECAVIGIDDKMKGQCPIGLIVLKNGAQERQNEIYEELISDMRTTIGPVASFKRIKSVPGLPKTRSGKILRATLRKMANGEDVTPPATIENPDILSQLSSILIDQ